MKIAIIDLGTNTFHLLIADLAHKDNPVIFKTQSPVKLGENMLLNNAITNEAYHRGIGCLEQFNSIIKEYEVVECFTYATACLRTARNASKFIDEVKIKTGIDINVITGEKEAQLIYDGVKYSGAITSNSLIMDIGGGSTEFIICDENQLIWKKSFPIGASKLMQTFFHSDPINQNDKTQLLNHLKLVLTDLLDAAQNHNIFTLIGSAGAFESFTLLTNTNNEGANYPLSLIEFKKLATTLEQSTHLERAAMKNLIPLRVDMIVMASMLTNFVIECLNITSIKVSSYDLKMGALKLKLDEFSV